MSRLVGAGLVLWGCLAHPGWSAAPVTGSAAALLTNSTFTLHPRMYYLNRHFDTPHTQESLALGGWVQWESGPWHGLQLGLVPYTSQRIAGEEEHDGASLLQPGQQGYTVLGQAYARWSGWDSQVVLYRQLLETPLLNSYDVKMTPVTFEAYTLVNQSVPGLTATFSQVEKIKPWTDSSFLSLSDAAGYADTDDGLTLGGLSWQKDPLVIQMWEYYAHNLANSVYAQCDVQRGGDAEFGWSLSAQGLHQTDVGAAYAGDFQTGMGGLLGGVNWQGFSVNLGGTITDKGADIFNPWASYPGYTSLMEEDCNLAGEKALMMGLAYDFSKIGLAGFSAFSSHSAAWAPGQGSFENPEQYENNITADYKPGGFCQGLWVRTRAAFVQNSLSTGGADYEDLRLIVNYEKKW